MTERFEVGQKVRIHEDVEGEVTYGPYKSPFGDDAYLVRRKDGVEKTWFGRYMSAIPTPPAFAVGDEVELTTRPGLRATVEYGPFDDRDTYVVKLVDEPANPEDVRTFTALGGVMRRVDEPIKVGDRVRVTDDDGGGAHRFNGRVGTVVEVYAPDNHFACKVQFGDGRGFHGDLNGRWNCRSVKRVADESTYAHAGVVYDLTATYNDRDGEPWTFKRFGDEVRGGCNGFPPGRVTEPLANVVDMYGPLTRVTD